MKLGPRGESLIKGYEQLRLTAYLPTPNDVPTIGWGHTKGVKIGDSITLEQAQQFFEEDVFRAMHLVNKMVDRLQQYDKSFSLTQSQFDALVSLVFNIETSIAPENSIRRALARGDLLAACQAFFLWRKQGSKDLLGLARRRVKEMSLFLEDDFNT